MQDAHHFGHRMALGGDPTHEFATRAFQVGVLRFLRWIRHKRSTGFSAYQEAFIFQLAVCRLHGRRPDCQRDGHGPNCRQLLAGAQIPQAYLLANLGRQLLRHRLSAHDHDLGFG
jgi:hypothetical protein